MESTNTSRAHITYKKLQGLDLTSDERIFLLEQEVKRLESLIHEVSETFLNQQTNNQTNPVGINDIHIGSVKYIYYIKEYQYKGSTYEQFLITLSDDTKFYMDKFKGSQPKVEDGDTISYKIDGDKLREVRVLYNV